MSEEVKAGDAVLYVPCVRTHWSDKDARGQYVFEFVATRDSKGVRAGEAVPIRAAPPEMGGGCPHGFTRGPDGELHTWDGHTVRPGACKAPWPATVVKTYPDGTADIDAKDPNGCVTHHKEKIRRDENKGSDTFYVPGGES